MFRPYRDLFTRPGAKPLVAAGLIARAPRAMTGIAILAMVTQRTGDYALASAECATYSLACAVLAPLVSRQADRHGQRRAARPALALALTALAVLAGCNWSGAPAWTAFPCVAVAGTMPDVAGMIRSRWTALYRSDPRLHTAFSVESVSDELTFIAGPICALTLATLVFPEAGLLCAMLFALVGVWAVTAQRRTEPEPVARPTAAGRTGSVARNHGLQVLVLSFIAFGSIFSATEVITVAFATERGHPAAASYALACYGITSCLAGLVVGALHPRSALPVRLLTGFAVLTLSTVPLVFVHSLLTLAAVLLLTGACISPTMITANLLVQRLVPAARRNEGLTLLLSGLSIGLAAGSVVGGWAVVHLGAAHAFVVPVGCALCALLTVLAGQRTLRRHQRAEDEPLQPARAPQPEQRVTGG
ncbi:MFS transporter [Kitasatospora sp. NBC_01302]|uniref:MFS transporter n=1 Tax=Kitasatospora sp. NBC_01302 TaxID=2903575 RepID=UPI002E13093A|nr:MFS transporter [Kitasatospora sp. NBC_01302]